MAHTDRDDARWFWKDHFDNHCTAFNLNGAPCICETSAWAYKWIAPYRYETGVPSWWHRDQRRQERTKLRQQLQYVDWDNLPTGEGKTYRRPYYW